MQSQCSRSLLRFKTVLVCNVAYSYMQIPTLSGEFWP